MEFTLHHGDCLDVMAGMDGLFVDAVIADPPYMIGATSVGKTDTKAGTWADMMNAALWYSEWILAAKRVCKPTAYLAMFGNWRSLPTYLRACDRAGLTATSCMVWDKAWIGPAGPSQLRPTYELVLIVDFGKARIRDRGASDLYRCKWLAGQCQTSGHPAEKPVGLMRRLVSVLSPSGGVVLDPFMGSGSTGVACVHEGRDFVGIDAEDRWVSVARGRIEAAAAQLRMDVE